MNQLAQNESHIDLYRRLRSAGKKLITKLWDAAKGPQYDMLKAARKLTLPVEGRTLIFDGETDTNALADFYMHEMRFGGKRIVDLLDGATVELTPEEADVLEGHRSSRCSLFEIVSADPAASQIKLRDLLQWSAEIVFTDISLSKCSAVRPRDMIFTRLVNCRGITMGAGLFFAFQQVHRLHLLNGFEARMRTVLEKERSQRTYIFFYQRYREFGLPQDYQNVV